MGRKLLVGLLLLAIIGVAGFSRARLEALEKERVPAELLYLPEGPYLRATALGHEETLADLIYIWAIQYYSHFEDSKLRFAYLERVFKDAIAELDPHFLEVYLVGAMVMSLEARDPLMALRFYDKGLEKNPDAWQLAYWAGWECYMGKRYERAREYWMRAKGMEGAPPQLMRLAAGALRKVGDLEGALDEYRRLAEQSDDEKTRTIASAWVDRLEMELAVQRLEEVVADFRGQRGRCPRSLEELVSERFLRRVPTNRDGRAFRYDPATCAVSPPSGQSFEGSE